MPASPPRPHLWHIALAFPPSPCTSVTIHPHHSPFTLTLTQVVVSFGLDGISFECWAGHGFLPRLIITMAAPILLVCLVLLYDLQHTVRGWWHTRQRPETRRFAPQLLDRVLKSTLPVSLRVLFLAFPIVTNVAFEAFACLTFDTGRQMR